MPDGKLPLNSVKVTEVSLKRPQREMATGKYAPNGRQGKPSKIKPKMVVNSVCVEF